MAEPRIPYVTAYGAVGRTLSKIKEATTPDRFTQDFLATKLDQKGGSPKPVIPFLKRTGFLASDGAPTQLYKRFRNNSQTGAAAAEALRQGYRPLYEANEYAHELSDDELKGLIVQVTGLEGDSGTAKAMIGSFKALREFADFEAVVKSEVEDDTDSPANGAGAQAGGVLGSVKLGYTINLNLPATSDVAVFNAIFKSLRDNLLR